MNKGFTSPLESSQRASGGSDNIDFLSGSHHGGNSELRVIRSKHSDGYWEWDWEVERERREEGNLIKVIKYAFMQK